MRRGLRLLGVILLCASSLWGQSFTEKTGSGIPALAYSSMATADFNQDGLMDVVTSGKDNSNQSVFSLLLNNGDNTFSAVALSITALNAPLLKVADFNNDNWVDFLYAGNDTNGNPVLNLFINDQSGGFTKITPAVAGLKSLTLEVSDINRDGYIDLIIAGKNNTTGIWESTIAFNDSLDFSTQQDLGLALQTPHVATLDYNGDAYPDLLISGKESTGNYVTIALTQATKGDFTQNTLSSLSGFQVDGLLAKDITGNGRQDILLWGNSSGTQAVKFLKYSTGSYLLTSQSWPVLSNGGLTVADWDNDGWPDLLFYGLDQSGFYQTKLWTNDQDETFTDQSVSLPGLVNGEIVAIDAKDDSKMDLVMSGISDVDVNPAIARLYENGISTSNTAPSGITNPQAFASDDSVQLTWNKGADTETPSGALFYNYYVSTVSKGSETKSPAADITNGDAYLWTSNPLAHDTTLWITGLPEGVYYYGIQTVDVNNSRSAFSSEKSFTICHVPNIGDSTALCYGDTLQLTAGTSSDNVKWYSTTDGLIATIPTLQRAITTDDSIWVEVTKPLGCTVTDTLQVHMLALPSLSLKSDTTVCVGNTIKIGDDYPGLQLSWYSVHDAQVISTDTAFNYVADHADTLIATAQNANGCTLVDSIKIHLNALPVSHAAIDTTICYGSIFDWTISESLKNITWYSAKEGSILQGNNHLQKTFTQSDTLWVEKENNSGCINYDTLFIHVQPLPTPSIGQDVYECVGSMVSIPLDQQYASVNWYSANRGLLAQNQDTLFYTISNADTVWAEVQDGISCTGYDSLLVHPFALPQFTLGNDTSVCEGSTVLLSTGTGLASVNWYNMQGDTLATGPYFYQATINKTDTFIAKGFSSNGCVNYDTLVVNDIPLPTYSVSSSSLSICEGESAQVGLATSLNSGDSIAWFSQVNGALGVHQSAFYVSPDSSQYFWFEAYNSSGCMSSDSVWVTVNVPQKPTLGADRTACQNETLQFSVGSQYAAIQWFSNQQGNLGSNASLNYTAITTDTLRVEVTDTLGCHSADTVVISVNPLPSINLADTFAICAGEPFQLSVPGADSTTWVDLTHQTLLSSADTLVLSPSNTIQVEAKVWNTYGCMRTDTFLLQVNALPVAEAGENQIICDTSAVVIGPAQQNGNWQYQWTPTQGLNDASVAQPTALPNQDTWYYLTVTNTSGCQATDSVLVQRNPDITIDAGADRRICKGESTDLGGNPTASGSYLGYQYAWTPEASLDDPSAANPSAHPDTTTEYTLVVYSGSCEPDTAKVTVYVNPLPTVTITQDTTIGAGSEVQLLATGGSYYRWTPAASLSDAYIANPIARPVNTTTYQVEVSDSIHCASVATVTIFVENQFFIPNLFTPNHDGKNDAFTVFGSGIKEIDFVVYDREGKKLYETTSVAEALHEGWDGTYQGHPVPNGTYIWVVKGSFYDGKPIKFEGKNNGMINLMR